MKLGKKALSVLLAITMIVTSVSVCFTVFGADVDVKLSNLAGVIDSNYNALSAAIDSGSTDRVPNRQANAAAVRVNLDTQYGAWYQVAQAYTAYINAYASVEHPRSYFDLYTNAITQIEANSATMPIANYRKVLSYFKFASLADENQSYMGGVTLKINSGYNILAYNTVEEMEEEFDADLLYTTAKMVFTFAAGGVTQASFTGEDVDYSTEVQRVIQILNSMLDSDFETWFQLDLSNPARLTSAQMEALVTDENGPSNLLRAYAEVGNFITSLIFPAGTSAADKAEALWNKYIAPEVGKTYDEALEWRDTALMYVDYYYYATQLIPRIDAIMAASDLPAAEDYSEENLTAESIPTMFNYFEANIAETYLTLTSVLGADGSNISSKVCATMDSLKDDDSYSSNFLAVARSSARRKYSPFA